MGCPRRCQEMPGLGNGLIRPRFILAPHLHPERLANAIGPFDHRLLLLSVRIVVLDRAILPSPQARTSLTPGARLLPAHASFVQRVEDGEPTHLGQAIWSRLQRPLQRAERPGSSAIGVAIWSAAHFLKDPCPLGRPVAARTPAAGPIIQSGQAARIEAPHQPSHGIVNPPPSQIGGLCELVTGGHGQEGDRSLVSPERFSGSLPNSQEFCPFRLRQGTQRLGNGVRHAEGILYEQSASFLVSHNAA